MAKKITSTDGTTIRALTYGLVLLLLSHSTTALPSTFDQQTCQLTVGWEQWRPFQFRDKTGTLTGLDVELTNAIFNDMKCKLSYIEMPWLRQKKALKRQEIDVIMSMVKENKMLAFSNMGQPFRKTTYRMFIDRVELSKLPTLTALEDLSTTSLRIGIVEFNSYQENYEKRLLSPQLSNNIIRLRNDLAVIRGLEQERLDGILVNQEFGYYYFKKRNMLDEFIALAHLSPPAFLSYIGFSKPIGTVDFISRFNQSLRNIRLSGEHQRIVDRYQ